MIRWSRGGVSTLAHNLNPFISTSAVSLLGHVHLQPTMYHCCRWLKILESHTKQLFIPIHISQLRISKQSSICSRGAGSSHSMDPGVSVQKQNFTRHPEKLAKVPGTREEAQSHLHWQFLGIWQSLWRSFLESLYVDTTQMRNKWDCWKSSAQSKRRHFCRIFAIRSGWKLVGRFHGMLYLSAKRSRSLVWWEDPIWETFWETI